MPRMCSAYGCSQKDTFRTRKSGVTFHPFPNDKCLRRQWELVMHKKMKSERIMWRPHDPNPALCSAHFRPKDFLQLSCWKKLKLDVVPSRFVPPAENGKFLMVKSARALTVVADSVEAALTTYFCPECHHVYREIPELKEHFLSSGHRFSCPKKGCDNKFMSRDQVIAHLTQGHSKQMRWCELCPDFCAGNAFAWSQHVKENHSTC